jgi:hypothetical protein
VIGLGQKLAEGAAHIRALALDVVFIGGLLLEDVPLLVLDALAHEAEQLRAAAGRLLRGWLTEDRE